MRCEELEAIVFSGREITAEERAEMEAHAETCEACRALMDNADALRGMQRIDEDVTPPESFTKGWLRQIRPTRTFTIRGQQATKRNWKRSMRAFVRFVQTGSGT